MMLLCFVNNYRGLVIIRALAGGRGGDSDEKETPHRCWLSHGGILLFCIREYCVFVVVRYVFATDVPNGVSQILRKDI